MFYELREYRIRNDQRDAFVRSVKETLKLKQPQINPFFDKFQMFGH